MGTAKNLSQYIRPIIYVVLCLTMIFTSTPEVVAIRQGSLHAIKKQHAWFDPDCSVNGDSSAESTSSTSSSGSVYVIGDSLTVGMNTQGELTKKLTDANLPPTQVEATVGISTLASVAKVQADAANVKSASKAIVGLGTNDRGTSEQDFKPRIEAMVKALRAAKGTDSELQIYWINTYSTVFNTDGVNAAIKNSASALNYSVIDWKTEATTPATPPKYGFDTALGVHQTSASGYSNMATFVTTALGGASQVATKVGGCSCKIGVSASLSGKDNAEQIWNFLTDDAHGLSPIQAAGVMGNMQQESGLDPENIQDPGGRSQNPDDAGSGGWGLIQWTPGSKIKKLLTDNGITGKVHELSTQLNLVWWHMGNTSPTGAKNMLAEFKNIGTGATTEKDISDSINKAVFEFEDKVEGAGKPAYGSRNKFAMDFYKQFGGKTATTSGIAVTKGNCGDVAEAGQDTQFVSSFVVYNQADPKWKDQKYGSSTVGAAGSGPTAMAMIIKNLTGQDVTPADTAKFASDKKLYQDKDGSAWTISETLASNWKLKAVNIGADPEKIAATLQAGGLVITTGQGAEPFTTGGQFLVIRGITASGKYRVGDPGHDKTNDQEWEPTQLLASMKGREGSVYAITK